MRDFQPVARQAVQPPQPRTASAGGAVHPLLALQRRHGNQFVQRKLAGEVVQRREVMDTKSSATNVLLFPETENPKVKVDVLAHHEGGLVSDTSLRPRVSAILGPGSTLRGIAKRIHPFFKTAGSPPTEDELAKAILVYSQYYLAVPHMTGFKVGLRLPLPIEIDVQTGEWVVNPGTIRTWAGVFDPKWDPLLSKAPSDLEVASAADLDKEVSDFLAQNPSALARGIALGARLLRNAFDSDQFALRVFDVLEAKGEAYDAALQLMNNMVNHQMQLLNSQGAGAAVLWRLRTILSLPPKGVAGDQRAMSMLPTETELGLSKEKRPIQAFFFAGETSE
ncbi:MAG TPA: hypothetical protein VFR31_04775, partial [Thermoanaerobaculia bacterium]|nr:hypothetical protein [Thermoanaerobaculia bacterium]